MAKPWWRHALSLPSGYCFAWVPDFHQKKMFKMISFVNCFLSRCLERIKKIHAFRRHLSCNYIIVCCFSYASAPTIAGTMFWQVAFLMPPPWRKPWPEALCFWEIHLFIHPILMKTIPQECLEGIS